MKNFNSNSSNIRNTFLNFFKKNNHNEVRSSPLIPENDPSILFTNSGMVQFKKWFTGEETPKHKNVVTIQKCLRAGGKHNDLENVGYTPRHHTFFEMLGNFSFGDYFKEEAIKFAWDLLINEFSIDKKRLVITVFNEDEISSIIWKKISGFSDNRIIRIPTNDNFWSMGETGPCGPCSEIFYDNGEEIQGGLPGSKNQDGDRFVEIWNLVFMEFEKQGKNFTKLPGKFVDTGMGLERIAAVLSNEINNYNTDLFSYLFEKISFETTTKMNSSNLIHFRIISDHLKSIVFMMSEGILPSNEGKGYVLRRIIRRALLNVNKLKPQTIILNKLVDSVIEKYKGVYFELDKASLFIKNNLKNEEEKFSETLSIGLELLNKEIQALKNNNFKPDVAFKLYDTYGFPVDMTNSILAEKKIKLNLEKYKQIVESNKEAQKKTWIGTTQDQNELINEDMIKNIPITEFCGYENNSCESKLIKIIKSGSSVDSIEKSSGTILIFDKTPFYAEAGGQIGDSGKLFDSNQNLVGEISDTKKIGKGIFLHFLKNCKKKIIKNKKYSLEIDKFRRHKIRNNHTATHLLHESLRQVVGKHVSQKGSLVNDKKLRFDYTSNEQLSVEKIKKIELLVNNSIRSNTKIKINKMPVRKAIDSGAIALFGEKYPEIVRVVSIINGENSNENISSIELCGGTHVEYTGQIGIFKLLSDTSVSSGTRRVEALTGQQAEVHFEEGLGILDEIKKILKASNENVIEKINNLKKQSVLSKNNENSENATFSKSNVIKTPGVDIYYDNLSCSPKELRNNADKIKKDFDHGVIILTTCLNKKVSVVVSVTRNLLGKFDSNEIIKNIISFLGGKGGGGRKDLSQGGAPLNKKFEKIKECIKKIMNQLNS